MVRGCNISYEDHLKDTSRLTNTVYIFHVYYCIARILKEIQSPLPTDASFIYHKNTYNKTAYQILCTEFNVSQDTDWRQKLESGCHGLGQYSQYFKPDDNYRYTHQSLFVCLLLYVPSQQLWSLRDGQFT